MQEPVVGRPVARGAGGGKVNALDEAALDAPAPGAAASVDDELDAVAVYDGKHCARSSQSKKKGRAYRQQSGIVANHSKCEEAHTQQNLARFFSHD